ncbi:MAG: DUF5752 family protein [Candidatus Margulisbacteria bacterium]|nr:DUF5752 family protein [Candidatus Margulisiibacteriota bacterium]
MKAKSPFDFYTSSQLVEITGKKASNLHEFVIVLESIDSSSIFYHVHHAFREHQFAPGLYTNDFAYWMRSELGENALAERIENINLKDYTELNSLREKIIEIIKNKIQNFPESGNIPAKHKFYFCRNIGVVQKTKYSARDLEEFCDNLCKVGLRSLFFHFFEARLRLGRKTNDFSDWIKHNFGDEPLARKIEALDPYLYTMDQLRDKIIALVRGEKRSFFCQVLKWLKLR